MTTRLPYATAIPSGVEGTLAVAFSAVSFRASAAVSFKSDMLLDLLPFGSDRKLTCIQSSFHASRCRLRSNSATCNLIHVLTLFLNKNRLNYIL